MHSFVNLCLFFWKFILLLSFSSFGNNFSCREWGYCKPFILNLLFKSTLQFAHTCSLLARKCFSFTSLSKYYEKEAYLADPVDGPILASLLGRSFSVLFCLSVTMWSNEKLHKPLRSQLDVED